MGPRQSLSEVVGTHVVLACKWIITVFLRTIPLPSPSPHPNGWRGGLSLVEIQRFCGICPKTFETDYSFVFLRESTFIMPRGGGGGDEDGIKGGL